MRRIGFVLLISALLFAVSCGGSHSSSTASTPANGGGNTIVTSGNNVAPLIVDVGTVANRPQANVAFTTVMVCAPQSSNCVTIDHIAVDTGSTGLRIPATAFPLFTNGSTVLAALQNVNVATPITECVQFLDNSFFFGSVRFADVKMGGAGNVGETAGNVPIHVMGDNSAPVPSSCSTVTTIGGTTITGTEEDTVATLGANGLLGVGNFQYDCDGLGGGNLCTSSAPTGAYYTCPGSTCSAASVPLQEQLRNPVSLFADNNGVILELPSVAVGGQTGIAAGQAGLVFGIGTQSNNALSSSAVVLALDSNPQDLAFAGFTTTYKGAAYSGFLDSGSNAIYFLDQPTSGIADCTSGFYCPSSTESLTAVNQAVGGNSHTTQFNASNADTLFNNNGGNDTAFSDLTAPNTSGVPNASTQADDGFFDWGLSFFYGRNVYVAIQGVTPRSGSSVPAGPFWAY